MIRTLLCAALAALNTPYFATPFNAFACGFATMGAFASLILWLERR